MTKLKFCGASSFEDYKKINNSTADYVGFVFAHSKRKVTPENVSHWIREEPPKISLVGVFVNPGLKEILNTQSTLELDVIQLHGTESISLIQDIKAQMTIEIWKAIPHSERALSDMKAYMEHVDGFVMDTNVGGNSGGTGVRFDWKAIPDYTKQASDHGKACMVAGGITSKNVCECLSYHPYGIDLSSGIERNDRKALQK